MRRLPLAALLCLILPATAMAHTGGGVAELKPGQPFAVFEMKALAPDSEGIYRQEVINFNKLRDGSALVFLAVDPVVKSEVAEARRFLALLKTLKNTHAFFVLPPTRSMRPDQILATLQKVKLELPFIIDDRDYFPFAFKYGLAETPRYELFDNTQSLVIRGGSTLSQRMPSQLTLAECIQALDKGKVILKPPSLRARKNIPPLRAGVAATAPAAQERTMKGPAIPQPLAQLAVNTIKMLAVDAVEHANSGHPGMPMGAAHYAFLLWARYLRFDPKDPDWPDRDRFVLSAGHGSMLLYALLHLSGYDLSLDDLKKFRQWGSRTPGHPELGHTPGVEVTTGPLGQGFANGVGLAIGMRRAQAEFNTPSRALYGSSRVYAIASDGDLMEGISHEAASLAGHLKLSNLTYLYDDNLITLSAPTDVTETDDVVKRFEGYGWFVQRADGRDHAQIERALDAALAEKDRPQLIAFRTHLADGAPDAHDTYEAHGSPLGAKEVAATKKAIGWPAEPTFLVPPEVYGLFRASAWGNSRRNTPPGTSCAMAGRRRTRTRRATGTPVWRARPLPTSSTRCGPRSLPAWTPPAIWRRRSNSTWPRTRPRGSRRLGRPRPLDQDGHQGQRGHQGGRLLRAKSDVRRPRARHGRHLQRTRRLRWGFCPSPPHSSSSPTTCDRPSGSPPSPSCEWSASSPMTASSLARTDRPTNPSSNSPRCASSRRPARLSPTPTRWNAPPPGPMRWDARTAPPRVFPHPGRSCQCWCAMPTSTRAYGDGAAAMSSSVSTTQPSCSWPPAARSR